MENTLLKKLAARGCAVERLLADTYLGQEGFYVQMLGRLPESTALARVRAAVAAGDAGACFAAAHELKGLYATLGLTPAWELCSRIVECVRPRAGLEGVEEPLAELEAVHAELNALILAD